MSDPLHIQHMISVKQPERKLTNRADLRHILREALRRPEWGGVCL